MKAEEGIRRAALMAQETENQVAFLKAEKNRNVSAIQSQEAIEKKRANATEFEIQYMPFMQKGSLQGRNRCVQNLLSV